MAKSIIRLALKNEHQNSIKIWLYYIDYIDIDNNNR